MIVARRQVRRTGAWQFPAGASVAQLLSTVIPPHSAAATLDETLRRVSKKCAEYSDISWLSSWTTGCGEWKGVASYFDVLVNGKVNTDAAW